MRAGVVGTAVAFSLAASPLCAATLDDLCEGVGPADGLCEVFEAPDERGPWGDLYGRFFEPLGFRRSVALVIGVSRYTGYPNLEAPVNDAKLVRDFLIDEAGFDIVITLTDRAATKRRIERLMEAHIPRLLEDDDRFLFYFSGHGDTRDLYGDRKRGYLVLSGASERDWPEMVGMDSVGDWWENIAHARQSLWVLDACFSGLAGTQRKGPLDDKTRRRLAQRAHHLITAGTSGEESVAVGGASLFTSAFIEAARDAADLPIADTDPDGVISLKEIDLYVGKTLDREIATLNSSRLGNPYKMSPQMSEFGDTTGEFFFMSRSYRARASGISGDYDVVLGVPETKGSGAQVAQVACDREADQLYWDSIRHETAPAYFEAYLARVESGELCGRFADIARLKVSPPADQGSETMAALPAERALSRDDRRLVQLALDDLGEDVGRPDGLFGPRTRSALAAWQGSKGYPETGHLDQEQAAFLIEHGQWVEMWIEARPLSVAADSGDVFRDCDACPEMVVIPAGEFVMGSPPDEEGRDGDEGPRHQVTIAKRFAVGKHEVTRGQFAAFVAATAYDASGGCRVWSGSEWETNPSADWRSPGFEQSDRHPVACVSWEDAQAYVAWLSDQSGQPYRLLSEAEWEYAARAETKTPFWTGSTISTNQANYDGNYTYGGGQKGEYRQRTTPVDEFTPNPWGLHDMHGNVWEWVEDCWNDNYDAPGRPNDGGAWERGDCGRRVLRGGSWDLRSGEPPLGQSLQVRHRRPVRLRRLPGCQDAPLKAELTS